MSPFQDRDAEMVLPSDLSPPASSFQGSRHDQDITERHKKLKRRYLELEEKHMGMSTELQRSGPRNVKRREDRHKLLDRVSELEYESQPPRSGSISSGSPPLVQRTPSTSPHVSSNTRSHDDVDSLLSSRHVPPGTRKYPQEQYEQLVEDEAGRSTGPMKGRHSSTPSSSLQSKALASGPRSPTFASANDRQQPSDLSTHPHVMSPGHHSSPSGHMVPADVMSPSPSHSPRLPMPPQSQGHLYDHQPPLSSIANGHGRDDRRRAVQSSSMDVEMTDGSVQPSQRYSAPRFETSLGEGSTDANHSSTEADFSTNNESRRHPISDSRTQNSPPTRKSRRSARLADVSSTRTSTRRSTGSISSLKPRITRSSSAALAAVAAAAAQVEARTTSRSNSSASQVVTTGPGGDSGSCSYTLQGLASSALNDTPNPPQSLVLEPDSPPIRSASNSTSPDLGQELPATSSQFTAGGHSTASSSSNTTPANHANPCRTSEDSSTTSDTSSSPTSVSQSAYASEPSRQTQPMDCDNIVKVAEAVVAAQKAANASTPNLSASSASPDPPSASSIRTNETSSAASGNSQSPINSSSPGSFLGSLANNPYLITTNLYKPSTMGPGMSSASPLTPFSSINPYAFYYSPGTPITPNTPTYPFPYANPYYYLTGPVPGPSNLYSPSPGFVSPSAHRAPSEVQRQAKPKRLKAHTVTSKSFSIPMVPRDKRGKPMLPLNVGIMTVINLGQVCMREHFHTERYIFPVGYEVTRRYLSTMDPNAEVVYHCSILDGGDGPKFQIIPTDVPDRPVIAGTATGAWSSIVRQANAIRNRQHSNSVSGPDFFGLGQNTIKHLIQELPNADRLRDYVWQNFVEGGPLGGRHAAVIPALPEDYDASLPISAHYQAEREKLKREANSGLPRGMQHYPQHIIAQAQAQLVQQQSHRDDQQSVLDEQQPESGHRDGSVDQDAKGTAPNGGTTPLASSSGGALRPLSPASRQSEAPTAQPSHPSPYTTIPEGSSSSSPPAVPATFASIMNAYPSPSGLGAKDR